jgi:hypothetical protein
MSTRRLSEIDLAKFAALSGDMLERALHAYNTGGGSWSYNPVRHSTADILAAKTPLLDSIAAAPWSSLERQITRACTRGEAQTTANVEVGKTLFEASRRHGWKAAKFDMGRLSIGFGESVSYWSDVVVEDETGLFVPFFDHRRAHGIANQSVRQIVHSMQHLWIRERYPDLMDARLAVVRFPSGSERRGIQIDFHRDVELLSYEELDARVRNVYQVWAQVSHERDRKKRSGTDGSNPFGF